MAITLPEQSPIDLQMDAQLDLATKLDLAAKSVRDAAELCLSLGMLQDPFVPMRGTLEASVFVRAWLSVRRSPFDGSLLIYCREPRF